MDKDFEAELIDESAACSAVQSAGNDIAVQSAEDCSADLTQTFTAHEIAERLGVSIRSVYDYANKLIEIWSWVQETEFRHRGRYTQKALDEMTRLKEARNANEYAATVTQVTGNYTPKGGSLARVEVTTTTNTLVAEWHLVKCDRQASSLP
jgi:transposase